MTKHVAHEKRLWSVFIVLYTICTSLCDASVCGGSLTSSTGTFTSPNYPMDYSNNLDCIWFIMVEEGRIIELEFNEISIERNYDYVSIFDDHGLTHLIERYHGHRKGIKIRSKGNTLVVRFTSDSSIHFSGFSASYSSCYVLGPGQFAGIVIGSFTLVLIVSSFTILLVKRHRKIKLRESLMSTADVAKLSHMTWDYLIVFDSKDPITAFAEQVMCALRCIRPKLAVRRTNVHRLFIEEEEVTAKEIMFFICEESTSIDQAKQLCSKVKRVSAKHKVLVNVLDRSCSSGQSYWLNSQTENEPENHIPIRKMDTIADIFQVSLEQYFNRTVHSCTFNINIDNASSFAARMIDRTLTGYLSAFGTVETDPNATANNKTAIIFIVDALGYIPTGVRSRVKTSGKVYVLLARSSYTRGNKPMVMS